MTKIIKSERVWMHCMKHNKMTEHMVYLKEDGKEVTRCLECAHSNPHLQELYGRQSPSVSPRKLDTSSPYQYGRQVA